MPGPVESLTERWRTVVDHVPDRIALAGPHEELTFADADSRSDSIAGGLLAVSDGSDAPVGLLFTHDVPLLVSALGLLKADRIGVALDPHLPQARLSEIIELAGIRVVIADEAHRAAAAGLADVVVLGADELVATGTPAPMRAERSGRDAAFIVFTSGSTGQPKGVVQTHDQLLNDVFTNESVFGTSDTDRIGLVLPFGFPIGLIVAMVGLLQGARLEVFDPRDAPPSGTVDWLRRVRPTVLICTPHLLRAISGVLPARERLDEMRAFATVGEAVTPADVLAIRRHLPAHATFVNWMGSSEIGALAAFVLGPGDAVPEGVIPAGRIAPNKMLRIVDDAGRVLPRGATGAVVAVSRYLSGGYWRDDAANARFGRDGDRVTFQQGDLGMLDERGDLVLVGRSDLAVKIRGYLVEPSEIERALTRLPGVAEAAVVPADARTGDRSTRLAAFVVPRPGSRSASAAELRTALRTALPEYMVPGEIVLIAALPRNERGKVDRAALQLPAPVPDSVDEPLNEVQAVLAGIWRSVLGLDIVTAGTDFMAAGGDSLAVEEMLAAVERRLGFAAVTADLVEAPTLVEFADRLQGGAAEARHPDVVALRTGTTGTPVFCFAGSGALALTFVPLARRLGDHDVYAFQQHAIEHRGLPDRTVEATATRFLRVIRSVRPQGPYILAGHSFGGLVALEIAHRLLADGDEVMLLALIDTYLPRESALALPGFASLTGAADSGAGGPVEWVRRRMSARLAGIVPEWGRRRYDAFFECGVRAWKRYVVRPYAGRSIMVFGEGNPDDLAEWRPILTGDATFAHLPVEHLSLLREPGVAEVAAVIGAGVQHRAV